MFCVSCGTQVAAGAGFCPNCGAKMPGAATPGAQGTGAAPAAAPSDAQASAQPQYGAAPPAAAQTGGLTENVAGLLCYVAGFITGILFLVIEPHNRNRFVRFHAWQSIFYCIAIVAVYIALGIVGTALSFLWLGWLVFLLYPLVWLGSIALWILLMVKAYQGQKWQLPIIGPLAEKQA